jgi:hypothetical protein
MEISTSKDKTSRILRRFYYIFTCKTAVGCNTPVEAGLKINENEEVLSNVPYMVVDVFYHNQSARYYMNWPTPTL